MFFTDLFFFFHSQAEGEIKETNLLQSGNDIYIYFFMLHPYWFQKGFRGDYCTELFGILKKRHTGRYDEMHMGTLCR